MNELLKKGVSFLKKPAALLVLGLAGIVLIFLSSLAPSDSKGVQKTASVSVTAEEYRQLLEADIKRLVKKITGDDDATVVITLESGMRYTYADALETDASSSTGDKSEQSSSSTAQSYITVKTADGGEQALLVTEMMPQVRGVAVVCRGGDNEDVSEKLRSAVMAALSITSKRVYIAGGNSYEKR